MHATEPVGPDSDPLAFELDCFERDADNGLELRGRWFGVRGRRFMRPTLTIEIDGARHRLLADLEHKPWAAEEGEAWVASFSSAPDMERADEIELSVASDIIVALSPPDVRAAEAPPRPAPSSRARPPAKPRRAAVSEGRGAVSEGRAAVSEGGAAVSEGRGPVSERRAAAKPRAAEPDRAQRQLRTAESSSRPAASEDGVAALRAELGEARAERETMLRELGLSRERVAELKHKLKKSQANTEALRAAAQSKFESQQAEVDRLRKQLQSQKALTGERDRLAKELKEAISQRDRIAAQTQTATPHTLGPDAEMIARAISARPASRAYRAQFGDQSKWPDRALAIIPLCVVLLALVLILHLA